MGGGMPRKKGGVEIGIAVGLLAAVAGCASGPAFQEDNPHRIWLVHTRAQPMSEIRACVGKEGAVNVCVAVNTTGQREDYPFQPAKVSELIVEMEPGGRKLRWDGEELGEIDEPSLGFLLIQPSWDGEAVRPSARDLLEVWLPFGYGRNQPLCETDEVDDQGNFRAEDRLDYAVFTIHFDGSPARMHIEKARCLTPED